MRIFWCNLSSLERSLLPFVYISSPRRSLPLRWSYGKQKQYLRFIGSEIQARLTYLRVASPEEWRGRAAAWTSPGLEPPGPMASRRPGTS